MAYVDLMLGKLFDCLKEEREYDETLIVFTGDHGESLGEHGEISHGFFAYNASIWVPLIIKAPGINPERFDQNVSHLDIYPTVCDILDIEKPSFTGIPWFPLLREKNSQTGRSILSRCILFIPTHGRR